MSNDSNNSLNQNKKQSNDVAFENTSGMGKNSLVPDEIAKKFNWGAFWLNWIWGVGNSVWIALFGLVVWVLNFIPIIGAIFVLWFCIWLGMNGNKWAWQNKRYNDIESFHKIQKTWAIVGWVVIFGLSLLGIIAALIIPTLITSSDELEYKVGTKKAVSLLAMSAQLNEAKNDTIPSVFDSESLAQYFSNSINGELSGKTIKADGMFYQFDANGSCTNNDCRVLLDTNGLKKGPNKYWEKDGEASDRIVIYIERKNGSLKPIMPPQAMKYNK